MKNEYKAFTRDELWQMMDRIDEILTFTDSESWRRVYSDLLHNLSTLDAFIARTKTGPAMGASTSCAGEEYCSFHECGAVDDEQCGKTSCPHCKYKTDTLKLTNSYLQAKDRGEIA